VEVRT
jgi:hypothetical protein